MTNQQDISLTSLPGVASAREQGPPSFIAECRRSTSPVNMSARAGHTEKNPQVNHCQPGPAPFISEKYYPDFVIRFPFELNKELNLRKLGK